MKKTRFATDSWSTIPLISFILEQNRVSRLFSSIDEFVSNSFIFYTFEQGIVRCSTSVNEDSVEESRKSLFREATDSCRFFNTRINVFRKGGKHETRQIIDSTVQEVVNQTINRKVLREYRVKRVACFFNKCSQQLVVPILSLSFSLRWDESLLREFRGETLGKCNRGKSMYKIYHEHCFSRFVLFCRRISTSRKYKKLGKLDIDSEVTINIRKAS